MNEIGKIEKYLDLCRGSPNKKLPVAHFCSRAGTFLGHPLDTTADVIWMNWTKVVANGQSQ